LILEQSRERLRFTQNSKGIMLQKISELGREYRLTLTAF